MNRRNFLKVLTGAAVALTSSGAAARLLKEVDGATEGFLYNDTEVHMTLGYSINLEQIKKAIHVMKENHVPPTDGGDYVVMLEPNLARQLLEPLTFVERLEMVWSDFKDDGKLTNDHMRFLLGMDTKEAITIDVGKWEGFKLIETTGDNDA